MADIRPFSAVRPAAGLEDQVAALPYDVYNRKEAFEAAHRQPLSFLNIDRPETQFPEGYDMYAPEVYEKAKEMLAGQIKEGIYTLETAPCFYLYEQSWRGRTQTGIVACSSVDDYMNGIIKKHENTRADKELDRIRHVDTVNAQTGPIFLAYRSIPVIADLIREVRKTVPDYSFTGEDEVTHTGWTIRDQEKIEIIRQAFSGVDSIYIADGHHRCASAVRVGQMRRDQCASYDGSEEFNYFLSVLFPDEELMIMDYNRVIKDLNGYSEEKFLSLIKEHCAVRKVCKDTEHPQKKGEVAMYLPSGWYMLSFPEEWKSEDPVEGLDVSILQNRILDPVLGIHDPRTDERIDFVGGIRGYAELERKVQTCKGVAFGMYPTSIHELFEVADAGLLMPPKSTWFEPKLRSGLYIHML